MGEQLWENEFEKLSRQDLAMFEDFNRWSPEATEMLSDLLRALRRKKGFGLFFVQCNPAQGERVVEAIRERFPQKRLEQIELTRQSETLYGELLERYQAEKFQIACVTGVEQALYSYEDTKRLAGWSSEEIYNYSWKGVPPLLSHLNRQREAFEANLPIALIFLVRSFAIDYFIQRAPDFFDWRSGFFKFPESSENLQKSFKELFGKRYKDLLALSSEQRMERILEIKDKILQLEPSDCEQKSNLLREQGRLFEIEKAYRQALDCYDRALTANPENHHIWNRKGSLLDDTKQYKEAIKSYDRALEIKPDYHYAWDNRGISLENLERYEEAIESYDRALEIKPDYHYSWRNKGDSLYHLERYEEAIESYDRALKIKPDYIYSWHVRGIALKNLERYEEAIESYDRALEIKPDYHYSWANRGDVLRNLERYEEAIESYDRALEIKPDYIYSWNGRGIALENLERYEEAIESYDRALEIKPDYHYAWDNKGDTFCSLQCYEEAIESYNRALEIKPDYIYSWNGRGIALENLERYEEAIESYDRALAIKPDYHYAWDNKGDAFRSLQCYEEAIESYNRALEIKPEYDCSWKSKGTVFYELGRHQEASDCFAKVAKTKLSDRDVWNNQGYLALAQYSYGLQPIFNKPLLIRQFQDCSDSQKTTEVDLERCQKALEFFDTALKIDPKYNLVWANRSFPAYYLQQYQTALQSCDKALELDPDNEEEMNEVVYSNRGCILLQLHNPIAALQDFTTALEIDPQLDEAWIGQGTALYYLGRYAEALHSFTQALNLNHPLAQTNLNLTQQHLEH